MSVKAPELSTTISADEFHALEEKVYRTIELLKTAREGKAAAERDAARLRQQLEETRELLAEFRDAGLGSLPGGGAEILHPEVRDQICEHKAGPEAWIRIHREAHRLGLRSNATMLYGHIEKPWHRIDHLIRLRELQDETGGFQTFIPLAFHPDNTKLSHLSKPSVLLDLRTMAVSRLMLDNFPHIKAYWIMLGIPTAQISLSYGADDIDGTVVHEKIYHDAGSDSPQELTVAQLRRLIEEAGRVPVERDTLYHRVERRQGQWEIGQPVALAMV